MGIKMLRRLQIGKEGIAGMPVAATTVWRGEGTLRDERKIQAVKEDVGLLVPTSRVVIPSVSASVSLDETPATFEQLPYILACGIENVVTGSRDGQGSGYVYQYDVPTTNASTIKTYTIEGGDDVAAYEVEYCFCESFTISGAANEPWQMEAKLRGRQATSTMFTSELPLPPVEEILFNTTKLYIDDAGGTLGATQLTNGFLGFKLNVETGWKPVQTGDGNLYWTFAKCVGPDIKGEIVLEYDDNAEDELEAARSGAPRLLRIQAQGTALTTPSAYTYKTARVDLAIQYTSVPALDDEDGNDIIKLPFRMVYDSAAGAKFLIVNELPELP